MIASKWVNIYQGFIPFSTLVSIKHKQIYILNFFGLSLSFSLISLLFRVVVCTGDHYELYGGKKLFKKKHRSMGEPRSTFLCRMWYELHWKMELKWRCDLHLGKQNLVTSPLHTSLTLLSSIKFVGFCSAATHVLALNHDALPYHRTESVGLRLSDAKMTFRWTGKGFSCTLHTNISTI